MASKQNRYQYQDNRDIQLAKGIIGNNHKIFMKGIAAYLSTQVIVIHALSSLHAYAWHDVTM